MRSRQLTLFAGIAQATGEPVRLQVRPGHRTAQPGDIITGRWHEGFQVWITNRGPFHPEEVCEVKQEAQHNGE